MLTFWEKFVVYNFLLELDKVRHYELMFIRSRIVKGNQYFYLVENLRVEGKPNPVQRVVEYLGNKKRAIATLEKMDIPQKQRLVARVRAATPKTGKNGGKRGRPRKMLE